MTASQGLAAENPGGGSVLARSRMMSHCSARTYSSAVAIVPHEFGNKIVNSRTPFS
jgi:hypothetical protein